MSTRIPAMLLLALAACGGRRSSAAASSLDPRLDLALVAPAAARRVNAPYVEIVPASALMVSGGDRADTLDDGDEVPDIADAGDRYMVRALDGGKRACRFPARTADGAALARAQCAALRVEGDRLIVPFALPDRPGAIAVDGDMALVGPEDARSRHASRAMHVGGHAFSCAASTGGDQSARALALCDLVRAP